MTGWWRRQSCRDKLRVAFRQLDAANQQVDFLWGSLADARAKHLAAEEAAKAHARKLRRIADVLADQNIDADAANQQVRQILQEPGPVSDGGPE